MSETPIKLQPQRLGATVAVGIKSCAVCGDRSVYAWAADQEVEEGECAECGEMTARFEVAHPLGLFPALEEQLRSRAAWAALAPGDPPRES